MKSKVWIVAINNADLIILPQMAQESHGMNQLR